MGNKSYWMADQKGNFSNDGKDTFDPKKGYVGVRLQQGVPLLDRDWNELEDIRRYQEMTLRKSYLGDGTPDDGFKISQCDTPGDDFKISKGRYLINGFEAVNEPDGLTGFVLYSKIAGVVPPLEPLASNEPSRQESVYIDLWISEITGASGSATPNEFQDPALDNGNDVKICTSVRHKIQWRIGVVKVVNQKDDLSRLSDPDHYYCKIAMIVRDKNGVRNENIQDYRSICLSLENLENTKKQLTDDRNLFISTINTILRGNIPSDPQQSFSGFRTILERSSYPTFAELRKGSKNTIYLFFYDVISPITPGHSNTSICVVEFTSEGWGEGIILQEGNIDISSKIFPLEAKGVMWLFWREKNQIYFSSESRPLRWEKKQQPLPETGMPDTAELLGAVGDPDGNKWIIWEGVDNKIYRRRCDSNGKWGKSIETTLRATFCSALGDQKGYILLFFETVLGALRNISCWILDLKYPGFTSMNPAEKVSKFLDTIEDSSGIWLLWLEGDSIWSRKWLRPEWEQGKGTKLVNSGVAEFLDIVGDSQGNLWLFWKHSDNSIRSKRCTSGIWEDGEGIRIISNIADVLNRRICLDSQGVVWFIFQKTGSSNIWCRRYIDGDWLGEMRLTSSGSIKILNQALEDDKKGILLFWQEKQRGSRISGDGNIQCKRCFDLI